MAELWSGGAHGTWNYNHADNDAFLELIGMLKFLRGSSVGTRLFAKSGQTLSS